MATHAAFDEGVRALLARPEGIEVLGVVADAVETDSAVRARGGGASSATACRRCSCRTPSHALRGIRYLEESGAGRGTFLPLASARTAARVRRRCATSRAAEPRRTRAARRPLPRERAPRRRASAASLPDALVVETLEDALEIVSRRRARSPA